MNSNQINNQQPDQTIAIVGLIATILGILPGLWAIIAGPEYRTQGIVQLALYIVSLVTIIIVLIISSVSIAADPLAGVLVGFTLLLVVSIPISILIFSIWIWSIVTMAIIVRDSNEHAN